nr:hypothetical protein Q903MT_gene6063 [Picea sitchensis]
MLRSLPHLIGQLSLGSGTGEKDRSLHEWPPETIYTCRQSTSTRLGNPSLKRAMKP